MRCPFEPIGRPSEQIDHSSESIGHPSERIGVPSGSICHPSGSIGYPFESMRYPSGSMERSFESMAHPFEWQIARIHKKAQSLVPFSLLNHLSIYQSQRQTSPPSLLPQGEEE